MALVFLFAGTGASAQGVRGTDTLDIRVSPTSPAPGQQTTITLTSTSIDLGNATISWTVDDNAKASGPGERSFVFTMGPVGKSTIVGVTVSPRQGSAVTRNFTFRPGSVTLLWEATTYTPPLYKGKALYSAGASIRVLAIPSVADANGTPIPANQLTFKWQIGEEAYADRSGLGRDLLLITGSQLREMEDVGVTVVRSDGSLAAASAIRIPATPPLVRFYRVDELRGTRYERSLSGEVQLTTTETTLVAEPYFISGTERTPEGFSSRWLLNNTEVVPQGTDRSMITLRQQGATGTALLEYAIESSSYERLLQSAAATIMLVLGERGASIF